MLLTSLSLLSVLPCTFARSPAFPDDASIGRAARVLQSRLANLRGGLVDSDMFGSSEGPEALEGAASTTEEPEGLATGDITPGSVERSEEEESQSSGESSHGLMPEKFVKSKEEEDSHAIMPEKFVKSKEIDHAVMPEKFVKSKEQEDNHGLMPEKYIKSKEVDHAVMPEKYAKSKEASNHFVMPLKYLGPKDADEVGKLKAQSGLAQKQAPNVASKSSLGVYPLPKRFRTNGYPMFNGLDEPCITLKQFFQLLFSGANPRLASLTKACQEGIVKEAITCVSVCSLDDIRSKSLQ